MAQRAGINSAAYAAGTTKSGFSESLRRAVIIATRISLNDNKRSANQAKIKSPGAGYWNHSSQRSVATKKSDTRPFAIGDQLRDQ